MTDTKPIILQNEFIKLEIQKPGFPYNGTRFDWTGQIIQITYLDKHKFCTTESLDKKMINKLGRGFYNEFGIDMPVGYDECKVGDKFPKVGVGMLTKPSSKPYDFFYKYPVIPFSYPYSVEDTKVQFFCEVEKQNEFAFLLDKRIELNKNTFTIFYSFSNYSRRDITTNEYVHNFLSVNGNPIGKDYELIFPFKMKNEKFGQIVNPEKIVKVNENIISWTSTPKEQFFFSNINSDYHDEGKWTLINFKNNVGISESTDFNIQKVNLWGAKHVVSPEIFFRLEVKPGKCISWSRTYTLFTL